VFLAAVLLGTLTAAQDEYGGVRARYWDTAITGTVRADGSGAPGTPADLDSDLDVDAHQGLSSGAAWVGTPELGRFLVDFSSGRYTAEESVPRDITYAGTLFPAGQTVESEFEWRSLTSLFEFGLSAPVAGGTGRIRLGLRSGTHYLRILGVLEDGVTEARAAANAVVPIVGGVAELYLGHFLSLEAEGRATHIESFGSLQVTLYEFSAAMRISHGGFFAGIGYRRFSLDLEDDRGEVDEVALDVTVAGFFLEAGFRF
jgi:hypothetical protein